MGAKRKQATEETEAKEALQRTAELVGKIVRVPKSELPTDSRKQPDGGDASHQRGSG